MNESTVIIANARAFLESIGTFEGNIPMNDPLSIGSEETQRAESSIACGLATLVTRQAIADLFETHRPDGAEDWADHFVPLMRDVRYRIGKQLSPPTVTNPVMTVYASAAYFVGTIARQYAPSHSLAESARAGDVAAKIKPIKLLQRHNIACREDYPLIEIVERLTFGAGIKNLINILTQWDETVSTFADEYAIMLAQRADLDGSDAEAA